MADGAGPCGGVVGLISLGFLIAIIVLSAKIYNATEKDPFAVTDNSSGNHVFKLDEALKQEVNRKYNFGKHCQCGEEIINDFCSEEQIIKGCFDVSLNKDKLLLRNLGDCDIVNEINNGGDFELNFDMVHKMSLGLLIVNAIVLGSLVFIMFVAFGAALCGECVAVCLPCMCSAIIALLFSGVTNLVLLIILMVNYYKGNTTGDLIDYYDCPGADKDAIDIVLAAANMKMEDLRNIDSNMTALVVLSFISIFLNCITSYTNKGENNN